MRHLSRAIIWRNQAKFNLHHIVLLLLKAMPALYDWGILNYFNNLQRKRGISRESVIKIWWPSFCRQVQVNGTSGCKRKHQEEAEGSSEDGSCSGCRLREMKASGMSRTLQGAVFWPSAWRTRLCTCTDCKVQLKHTDYRGHLLTVTAFTLS